MSATIADYASRLRFEDLDQDTVEFAKQAVLDTVGVALAGLASRTGTLIADHVARSGSRGAASAIGIGEPVNAEDAALANATMAHALDFDDASHSSAHCLPTALAAAESEGLDGKRLLTAFVVGREVRMHLNPWFDGDRAHGGGPGGRGWHSTGVLGSIASAAAAASALSLGSDQTAGAIGIAASLGCGVNANWGTMTKPLHAGAAARNGVLAASLARSGFTSAPDALTGLGGLVEALGGDLDGLLTAAASLGEFSYLGRHGPQVKRYPTCFSSHGYIEAIQRMQAAEPVDVSHIASIVTTTNRSLRYRYPTDDLTCKFSAAFVVVATLLDGTVGLESCTSDYLARPDVQRLLGCTDYVDDGPDGQFVRLVLHDGRVHSAAVQRVAREPDRAFVEQKYRRCSAGRATPRTIASIQDVVARLDADTDARDLGALLRAVRAHECLSPVESLPAHPDTPGDGAGS